MYYNNIELDSMPAIEKYEPLPSSTLEAFIETFIFFRFIYKYLEYHYNNIAINGI